MGSLIIWGSVCVRSCAVAVMFCGPIILDGCASADDRVPEPQHVSAPPVGGKVEPTRSQRSEATSASALVAAPAQVLARGLGQLTPELVEAFHLSSAISDQAGVNYEAAISAIRGDARQGKALRDFYAQLPVEAYGWRRQVVEVSGMIGTRDDIPMLEKIAMTPLSPRQPAPANGDDHQPTTTSEEGELRIMAIASISRIAQRGEAEGVAALKRLLTNGDKEMATLAGVEMADSNMLGAAERRVLTARGIRGTFAKLDFEKTFRIDPASLDASPPKRPVVVPPAAP